MKGILELAFSPSRHHHYKKERAVKVFQCNFLWEIEYNFVRYLNAGF
jgi:hypothetical protein